MYDNKLEIIRKIKFRPRTKLNHNIIRYFYFGIGDSYDFG